MTDDIITQFIELFYSVDDFCIKFQPKYDRKQLEYRIRKRNRKSKLSLSEVITIII